MQLGVCGTEAVRIGVYACVGACIVRLPARACVCVWVCDMGGREGVQCRGISVAAAKGWRGLDRVEG